MIRQIFLPRWSLRATFLLTGVLIVSAAFGLFFSASETTVVRVNEDLARYWRTTYDILVRPPGYRSEIEAQHGLVRAGSLLEISGGIPFTAYEAIKNVPGVEVAAPVAVLSFWNLGLPLNITDVYPLPEGVIANVCTEIEDDGLHVRSHTSTQSFGTPLFDPDRSSDRWRDERAIGIGVGAVCNFEYSGMIVAIDPEAEEALIGLSQSLSWGDYLRRAPIKAEKLSHILAREVGEENAARAQSIVGEDRTVFPLPLLVNTTTYISLTLVGEAWQLAIPPEAYRAEEILRRGGVAYLSTLPRTGILARSSIHVSNKLLSHHVPATSGLPYPEKLVTFSPVRLRSPSLSGINAFVEAVPLDSTGQRFREMVERPVRSPDVMLVTQGHFESEKLKFSFEELTAVPDVYFPPVVILRYNESGLPVEKRVLRPTTRPDGYLQPPALALTTMEAAQLLCGDDCISAIRVRVAGVDRFSPEAQSKIEAVAAEIINRTGLDVDIVVGSSPRPVLVHLPGIGYVEEYWVQKGVALTTHREVQRANLLLFAAMLAVCALFIFNTTSTTVAGRIGEFGLLKALGWRGVPWPGWF